MIRKLLPHPYLTLLITLVWAMLNDSLSPGTVVFGLIIGLLIPQLTAPYWPNRSTIRIGLPLLEFGLVLIWDIVTASVIVAGQVLFVPNARLRPAWVAIPIDLRRPEAITLLAGTITMTPGTVTADISADGRALLVHCLHAPDPDAVRDNIKSRYERRIKEIFE